MTVCVLNIPFTYNSSELVIHPVVLLGEAGVVLIDCGYPGFMPLIEKAMQQYQLSLSQLTHIIITHADIDHVGGLFEIKEKYPHIKVYSSGIEADYINGKEKPARLLQAEQLQEQLQEDKKATGTQFISMLKAIPTVPIDGSLQDGEMLAFLPGAQIIYTPGHTPGHFSLYMKESKTLIAADAVVIENGVFDVANPQFAIDLFEAVASVKKIAQMDIEKLICYHGGATEQDVKTQLSNLIERYEHI